MCDASKTNTGQKYFFQVLSPQQIRSSFWAFTVIDLHNINFIIAHSNCKINLYLGMLNKPIADQPSLPPGNIVKFALGVGS
jgi:hypothetical protein